MNSDRLKLETVVVRSRGSVKVAEKLNRNPLRDRME
jgi:hypothetical protein